MSKPEEKPKRRLVALSTKLSAMAAIEEVLNSLSEHDRPAVVNWFIGEYSAITRADQLKDAMERG